MSRTYLAVSTGLLTCALLLAGCATGPEGGAAPTPPSSEGPSTSEAPPVEPVVEELPTEEPEPAPEPEPAQETPAVQAESCDWDSAPLDLGAVDGVPSGPGQDPATALVGAWQHTHIDSGAGFEALGASTDIRYVFPSATRLLYCQDVEGATDQAENAVDITLDGPVIVLPAPATGYEITAWTADTMVWTNQRDGSTYLLRRR